MARNNTVKILEGTEMWFMQ